MTAQNKQAGADYQVRLNLMYDPRPPPLRRINECTTIAKQSILLIWACAFTNRFAMRFDTRPRLYQRTNFSKNVRFLKNPHFTALRRIWTPQRDASICEIPIDRQCATPSQSVGVWLGRMPQNGESRFEFGPHSSLVILICACCKNFKGERGFTFNDH